MRKGESGYFLHLSLNRKRFNSLSLEMLNNLFKKNLKIKMFTLLQVDLRHLIKIPHIKVVVKALNAKPTALDNKVAMEIPEK